MTRIVGQELDVRTQNGRDQPRQVTGVTLENCEVMGNMLASRHPGEWRIVRDCAAIKCRHYNTSLSGTAIEDCLLDGLGQAGPGYFQLDGCVFRHVTVRGSITTTQVRFDPHPFSGSGMKPDFDDMWRDEWVRYYRDVDWALDIRDARFRALTPFAPVPGHLVRYDPERAIRVRRTALTKAAMAAMPMLMQICCEDFVHESPFDSFVIARGETKKNRETFAAHAAWMRTHGLADPD